MNDVIIKNIGSLLLPKKTDKALKVLRWMN